MGCFHEISNLEVASSSLAGVTIIFSGLAGIGLGILFFYTKGVNNWANKSASKPSIFTPSNIFLLMFKNENVLYNEKNKQWGMPILGEVVDGKFAINCKHAKGNTLDGVKLGEI